MWTSWLVTAQVELITLRKHTHLMALLIFNEVNNYTCFFFFLWHVEIICQTSVSVPASPRYTLTWVSVSLCFFYSYGPVCLNRDVKQCNQKSWEQVYMTTRTKPFHFHSSCLHYSYKYQHKPPLQSHSCLQILLFFNGKVFAPTERGEVVNGHRANKLLSVPSMGH